MADIAGLLAALDGIEVSTDRALLRQKSRDFYWYSPILKAILDGKAGELYARPKDEAEVLRILAACRAARVPVTTRGGGTGNYGQCVPLEGGVILDMTAMAKPISLTDGVVDVECGMKMIDLDLWARDQGWELKLWPSTKRTATIGGFVAGGGAGVGGIAHGTMRERGNLVGARVATMQDPPVVLDLEGDDASPVNRTYGTTGIMTRIRLPLTPAQEWRDIAIGFEKFTDASAFALALAFADGIPKKMCAVFDSQLPPFFRAIADSVPAGQSLVLTMVAPSGLRALRDLARDHNGTFLVEQSTVEAERDPDKTPFYEYCWNHTTLQVLKKDRGVSYLQCRFPFEDTLAAIEAVRVPFRDEVWMHTECVRFGGRTTMSALPVIRWTSAERMHEIMAAFEAVGIGIANPHVLTIEEGSNYRRVPGDQLGFKQRTDPLGLLNPGKMRDFVPAETTPA
ncbi:FAD-binding oxidoreductase [Falsiroseomonas stagni]|uniref:FAD/FMN-containing dehydrogenase n=1 Tax=Falsiroseomonas stagni DSM 19981 TaxID=1123062 RepID=A0A1I4CDV4_9PROT|nr:FAD-binding oxidoreductase [Falsiroseomonas stagni]SFK79105.1 FAD/FMN-containing dehydrogenase [Falsiroseomonas stagni DSM 19981]